MKTKKTPAPFANANVQITAADYSMSFSYDSQDKKVSISLQGSPAAIVHHLMRAFRGAGPLFGALQSTLPKTDREITRETITEQNQRRNPSLRPGYRAPAVRAFAKQTLRDAKRAAEAATKRRAWNTINGRGNPQKNPRGNSVKMRGRLQKSAKMRREKG